MCINSYINKYIFIIITNKIVKMHNNRNINTYIYYLDKHKKRVIGQKALLISKDTNKAYLCYLCYLCSFNHAIAYSAYTADAADNTLSSMVNRLLW